MRFTNITIRNFRTLDEIETELSPCCSVIVGPNAVGKTTILDAIRLAKALLAPRTQQEPNQTLFSLGASSPHDPALLDISALAGDPSKPVYVSCGFTLESTEMATLLRPESVAAMATQAVMSNLGAPFGSPAQFIGFFSSAQGQQALSEQAASLASTLTDVHAGSRVLRLCITLEPGTGRVQSDDPLAGIAFGHLDKMLPAAKTLFSYFPADRAIPSQEAVVQIGPADSAVQLESYNSQPQLKYSRLKNTVFNAVISGQPEQQQQQQHFANIFANLLRGRELNSIGLSPRGGLRVNIRDPEKDRTFSIDGMSSGEKGLILTCLLIAQTMMVGGIVLIDEPELHLNPSVCRELLTFLVSEYAKGSNLQFIICSHSPDMVAAAFERPDCKLYHLVSGNELAALRSHDYAEIESALRKLGSSQAESLLYKGIIFVEGSEDAQLLRDGFPSLFRRYTFRVAGGRSLIETQISALQDQDKIRPLPSRMLFILDNDGKSTRLSSKGQIRVHQWERYCIENYLIDEDAMTDFASDEALVKSPITNTTALKLRLKALAFEQIHDQAFWTVFRRKQAVPALKARDISGKSFLEASELAEQNMLAIADANGLAKAAGWRSSFISECEAEEARLRKDWDCSWMSKCNGKRLIEDFHRVVGAKLSMIHMKVRIIENMASRRTKLWIDLEKTLADFVS